MNYLIAFLTGIFAAMGVGGGMILIIYLTFVGTPQLTDTTDNGRVTASDVAWAFFCSISAFSSIGTAIIPPPEPNSPLANPVSAPRKAKYFFFIFVTVFP